jgi:hypothetical protein
MTEQNSKIEEDKRRFSQEQQIKQNENIQRGITNGE